MILWNIEEMIKTENFSYVYITVVSKEVNIWCEQLYTNTYFGLGRRVVVR